MQTVRGTRSAARSLTIYPCAPRLPAFFKYRPANRHLGTRREITGNETTTQSHFVEQYVTNNGEQFKVRKAREREDCRGNGLQSQQNRQT